MSKCIHIYLCLQHGTQGARTRCLFLILQETFG